MQILKLRIENFLSYEEAELDLADRGLVLVEGENRDQGGSNGAGKTTIFEAICWAIFGTTNSGLRGDDVVRWDQKDCRVSVVLAVDGHEVAVVRYRRHHEYFNQMHLAIDGVDSRAATDRETQDRLLQLVQLDWSTFISVVMFPQGKDGIAAWTDADQKTVLDTLLALERFQAARARVMEFLKKDEARVAKLTADLQTAEGVVAANTQHATRLEAEHQGFEVQHAARVGQAEQALQEAEGEDPGEPVGIQTALHDAQARLAASRQDDVLNMIAQLEHKAQQLKDAMTLHQARYQTVLGDAQRWQRQILDPEVEVAKHQDCPSCGQILPEEAREKLYSTFSEQAFFAREQEKIAREEMLKLDAAMRRTDVQMAELTDVLAKTREKLTDVSDLEQAVVDLKAQLQAHHSNVQSWMWKVTHLRSTVDGLRKQESPFAGPLKAALDAVAEAEERKQTVTRELEPLREDVRYLSFWRDGFGNGGVKSLLMSTVTPLLNTRANVYMSDLTNGAASITIKTQKRIKSGEFRDKLDFAVEYPQGGALYRGKSGGERRRADLSILLALGDLAASRARAPVQLRLLDEPFESLDQLGCEQVVALLQKHLVPRAKTVLVMSHNESLKQLFDRRITVVKENGVSRIE